MSTVWSGERGGAGDGAVPAAEQDAPRRGPQDPAGAPPRLRPRSTVDGYYNYGANHGADSTDSTDMGDATGRRPPERRARPRRVSRSPRGPAAGASPRSGSPRSGRRRILLAVLGVVVLLLAYPAWQIIGVWNDWRGVEREMFDRAAFDELPAVEPLGPLADGLSDEQTAAAMAAAVADPAATAAGSTQYQTFMIVGLDDSELRADVIVLAMLPDDGSPPVMVSLPRDLYLPNRCTQNFTRINANFNGCGDINGATALSGAVKDFTGHQVDHFALFTFDGFAEIIDQLGGVEICVEHPTREDRRFELPAGCTQADGQTTLGWVRSRRTQEFVDGRWRTVTDVSDLTRNQRQQDLIISIFQRAAEFSSPQEMSAVVGSMADAFTLDDQLGLGAAIDLAWTNRNLDTAAIVRPKIPVSDHVTPGGAQVLIPTEPFQQVLDDALGR